MTKRLYRSKNSRLLAGICGGIANYFNIDPIIIRIIAIICLLAFNIMAVIAYIILIFVIPLEGSVDAKA